MIADYKPGDVGFTNDTYSCFVATHTPDTVLWKPVFHEGEIIAWTGGHIHNTDMGGAVPASLSRALTEIHQEGIRFPPMKLVEEGVFDEMILRIMTANVRKPELNVGDIKALVGALTTGERKILAMVKKFGKEAFLEGVDALMDHSEAQAREVLRSMPDGTWEFADYADEDSAEANPMRLKLSLTIRGDEALLDFTGSDPQLGSSLNVPTGGDPRHSVLLVGIYYVLYTLNPALLLNTGMTRPFTCITPEGSVLNPHFPAAVGMRSLTCARLRSVIFGAFSQVVPDRLPAAPAGNNCIVNVMTTDERTKRTVIAAVNPVVGGGGAMPHRDGTNGSGADAAYLKNTPIEITETETPIEFVRYGLARDSGGPGALAWRPRDRDGIPRIRTRQPDHGAKPGPQLFPALGRSRRARGGSFRHGRQSRNARRAASRQHRHGRSPAGRRTRDPLGRRGRARRSVHARASPWRCATSSAAMSRAKRQSGITAWRSAAGASTRPRPRPCARTVSHRRRISTSVPNARDTRRGGTRPPTTF